MVFCIFYNNQYNPTSDVDCKIILKNKLVVEDMLVEDIQVVEAVLDSLEVLHKDLEVD